MERVEGILYDLRLRFSLAETRGPQVVIVDIDEKSLAKQLGYTLEPACDTWWINYRSCAGNWRRKVCRR